MGRARSRIYWRLPKTSMSLLGTKQTYKNISGDASRGSGLVFGVQTHEPSKRAYPCLLGFGRKAENRTQGLTPAQHPPIDAREQNHRSQESMPTIPERPRSGNLADPIIFGRSQELWRAFDELDTISK